jgi:hypothetical protein
MGATGWSYFVPYQQDIDKALQELKDRVFRQGQYENPFEFDENEFERQRAYLASIYQTLPEGPREQAMQLLAFADAVAKHPRRKRAPKTIKQLLKQCGTEGTHSILDMEQVSSTPTLGAVAPLSNQQLLDIFGTEKPTHEMVEKWSTRIAPLDAPPLYECWEGIYLIVYQDAKPDEIYFEGCSGD